MENPVRGSSTPDPGLEALIMFDLITATCERALLERSLASKVVTIQSMGLSGASQVECRAE